MRSKIERLVVFTLPPDFTLGLSEFSNGWDAVSERVYGQIHQIARRECMLSGKKT